MSKNNYTQSSNFNVTVTFIEEQSIEEIYVSGEINFTVEPLPIEEVDALWKLGNVVSDKEGTYLDEATGLKLEQFAEMVGYEPEVIHYCPYNDCGWCYYRGDGNSNDNNGQCNKPQQCEVNINGE